MMETIINNRGRDYRMAVVFVKKTGTYTLQFASLSNNTGADVPNLSFMEARERFINNCRFYGVAQNIIDHVPFTEEQFLGITPGLLYPRRIRKGAAV